MVFRTLMRDMAEEGGAILSRLLRIHSAFGRWETRLRGVQKFLLKFEEIGADVDTEKIKESCSPEVVSASDLLNLAWR